MQAVVIDCELVLLPFIYADSRRLCLLQFALHQMRWVTRHATLFGFGLVTLFKRDLVEGLFAEGSVDLQIVIVNEHLSFSLAEVTACFSDSYIGLTEARRGHALRIVYVSCTFIQCSANIWQSDAVMFVTSRSIHTLQQAISL